MQKKNIEVLRKILYAVETGGQVYGNQDYADFTEAYTNSKTEHAITIGAGQWYAREAKRLLQKIQRANPAQFKKMDTQGIETDLLKKDWATYAIATTSAKAKCIVTIINSTFGRKCQDELMDEQITEYAASIAKAYGTMPDTAMMECINIIHQGGNSALKRILAKTAKPYTDKSIYAALNTDPADPRTNQVGDYTARQKKVYEYITKYASDATTGATASEEDKKEESAVSTVQETINKAITWMEETAKDDRHGYCQDHRWGTDGDYDCSSAVITAWEQAGVPVKTKGATYTGNMLPVFKANGFVDVTAKVNRSTGAGLVRGDVLLNAARHTAMYCGNGMEVEASINEKGTAHGGTPGDQTGKEFLIRSYRNYPWTNVLRYTGNGVTIAEKNYLEMGDSGAAVKTMQTMLIECGYSCGSYGADGDFGFGTDTALRKFQKDNSLVVDGQYGQASKAKLVALYNAKTGGSNTGNGKNPSKTPKWVGTVNTAELNVRTGAGTGNPKLADYPLLRQRNLVDVCDTVCTADGTDWYYVRIAGKYFGYVCAKYISKV
mgnify:CR=1 FL=1